MAKAIEKTSTLTVRGEGGAVWEVDDTGAGPRTDRRRPPHAAERREAGDPQGDGA